jgi:signal transduction histidine kinase
MEFSRRASIPIQVEIEPDMPEIPDHLAVTLYRILQEALTNVAKHAKARKVWVDLTQDHGITLSIQDNGRGYSPGKQAGSGIGLTGIRERLELVGGRLDIRSGEGRGTIHRHLPLTEFTAKERE